MNELRSRLVCAWVRVFVCVSEISVSKISNTTKIINYKCMWCLSVRDILP